MNHAIRVSRPYSDISGALQAWYDRAKRVVVYEHEADEEVKRTHVHIALYGVDCKEEALKRDWKDRTAEESGNKFWSFKPLDGIPDGDEAIHAVYDDKKKLLDYIKYMTKGKYAAKFAKDISPDLLEAAKSLWEVTPPKPPKVKKESSDYWTLLSNVRDDAEKRGYYTQQLNDDCELVRTIDKIKLYKLLIQHMNKNHLCMEVNQMCRLMATLCRDDPIHGEEIRKTVFRRLFS